MLRQLLFIPKEVEKIYEIKNSVIVYNLSSVLNWKAERHSLKARRQILLPW